MYIIFRKCELCDKRAVILWVYVSDGIKVDECALCEDHA